VNDSPPVAQTPTPAASTSVAPAPPEAPLRRRRALLWWFTGTLAAALVAGLIGATFVPLPYYAIKPGSVRTTGPLIVVDGQRTYPPKGSVAYTTVGVKRVTALQAFAGWLNKDVDVVEERVILGDRNPSANRQFDQQLMTSSKFTATQVALEYLGYPVKTSGSLVVGVVDGLPAAAKLHPGDAITAVDGEPIDQPHDLTDLLAKHRVGDTVALQVDPVGKETRADVSLTLAASPSDPQRGVLGVQIQDRDPVFPFKVNIDTGRVGGPSAGLAFTLGLIDVLTPGELTPGGERIACTGTIEVDGSVGPVGGVAQKTAAVRDAGVKVFLVPSDEYAEAKAKASKSVRVMRVDTLQQALDALRSLGGDPVTVAKPAA
jgi:PDZ domain-containing protein